MSRSLPLITGDGPVGRFVSHVRTPLFGSAYALILSSVSTSALGLVYWTLAAHLYPAADVGVNAAAISTMTFISYLAQLNMASGLSRFVPTAGAATRALIVRAYSGATIISGLAAGVFVFWLAARLAPGLPDADDPLVALWFVLATMGWSLFALQDGVLTGLQQTVWVPIENTIFAGTKIVLLIVFAGGFAGFSIFASWTIPAALMVIPVNLVIFRLFVPRHVAARRTAAPEAATGQILRYLAGDYVGSLFVSATVGLLPLIVLAVAGAAGSGYFYVAWTIAYSMQLISINMATSLMVQGSVRREQLAADSRRMVRVLLGLQLPAVAVVVLGAPMILRIFGHEYASEAETLLRLLALAVIPHGLNSIYLSLARVQRKVGRIVMVQGSIAILALSLSVILLAEEGIAGVGIAWLIAQTTVALVLLTTQLVPLWRGSRTLPLPPATPSTATAPVVGTGPVVGTALLPGTVPVVGTAPTPVFAEPSEATTLLRRVAAELDQVGVGWVSLRPDAVGTAVGDTDLLVRPGDLAAFEAAVRGLGFIERRAVGRATHRFFLGRDERTGTWAELDVVSELAYGRSFELRSDLAEGCIARRRVGPDGMTLDPDDAFWTLLLHCVLDKGSIRAEHRDRLARLADEATAEGAVAQYLAPLLPDGLGPDRLRTMASRGDADGLLAVGPALEAAWRRRDPIGTRLRAIVRRPTRALEPLLLAGRRGGLSVALLGPDGAGKSTLALGIAGGIPLPVGRVYMGLWARSGRRQVPLIEILVRPARIWARYIGARAQVAAGRLVIFDRYTYDASLPPHGRLLGLKRAYFWLLAHAAPAPDLILVLDAPGELLHARKGESDPARLEADRAHFRRLAERRANVQLVDASRPAAEVLGDALTRIWQAYLDRTAREAVVR